MRARCTLSLLLALAAGTRAALAGNLDSYYMDSDAALQGGAITADTASGAAIWYNPAGLASIQGLRLDVGMNAFRLSLGAVPEVEASGRNPSVTRLSVINFASVP